MTVRGMDTFKAHFAEFQDCYTLIGGSACDLIFAEQGLAFRATKDLDIVVLANRPAQAFAEAFWRFVREGGYTCGWRNDPCVHFYRFTEPKEAGYPHMIELFARHPDFDLQGDHTLVPLPLDDDISSLSAILLDDDYYEFLTHGLSAVGGVSIVDVLHLIPLKARAHVDLNDRKARGQHVNSADLKKHKKDVLRLVPIAPADARVDVCDDIKADMGRFVSMLREEGTRVDQLGTGMTLEGLLGTLERVYDL